MYSDVQQVLCCAATLRCYELQQSCIAVILREWQYEVVRFMGVACMHTDCCTALHICTSADTVHRTHYYLWRISPKTVSFFTVSQVAVTLMADTDLFCTECSSCIAECHECSEYSSYIAPQSTSRQYTIIIFIKQLECKC
jgi:hypothetical protein